MNSWRGCNLQNLDEAALHTSDMPPVMRESDAPNSDDKDQPSGTCIFGSQNRIPKNNCIVGEILQQNESYSSFHNQSYIEKIKEFQLYVDMVKRLTRPGCSVESLDIALSSMSSLVNTLSAIPSKHHIIRALL